MFFFFPATPIFIFIYAASICFCLPFISASLSSVCQSVHPVPCTLFLSYSPQTLQVAVWPTVPSDIPPLLWWPYSPHRGRLWFLGTPQYKYCDSEVGRDSGWHCAISLAWLVRLSCEVRQLPRQHPVSRCGEEKPWF